jgi:hypothetical protein
VTKVRKKKQRSIADDFSLPGQKAPRTRIKVDKELRNPGESFRLK